MSNFPERFLIMPSIGTSQPFLLYNKNILELLHIEVQVISYYDPDGKYKSNKKLPKYSWIIGTSTTITNIINTTPTIE